MNPHNLSLGEFFLGSRIGEDRLSLMRKNSGGGYSRVVIAGIAKKRQIAFEPIAMSDIISVEFAVTINDNRGGIQELLPLEYAGAFHSAVLAAPRFGRRVIWQNAIGNLRYLELNRNREFTLDKLSPQDRFIEDRVELFVPFYPALPRNAFLRAH